MEMVVYTQASCMKCHAAIIWLGQMKIPFTVKDVYTTPGALDDLRAQHIQTLPAFAIDGRYVEGFRKEVLLATIAGALKPSPPQ